MPKSAVNAKCSLEVSYYYIYNCNHSVIGLSRETSTDGLRQYFERFGEIKDAVVKMDPATGQSRGFGFILFCYEASIEAVLAAGNHEIDGKTVSY